MHLLIISLLVTLASTQNLQFVTNAGQGRYQFSYPEYAVDEDGILINDHPPPGRFSVACFLDGQPSSSITYARGGGNDNGIFQVNSETGVLVLQDGIQLDYETRNNYQFSVTCSAPPARDSTAQVDFNVGSENEFHPVVTPAIRFLTIREDIPIDTVIASTRRDVNAMLIFSGTDRDTGPDGQLQYTLPSNDSISTAFRVEQVTGTLTVIQSLDVDNTPRGFISEEVRLTVCDRATPALLCPSLVIRVIVTSVNDNSPTFEQQTYQVSVMEDFPVSFVLTNVSCTDNDVGVGAFQNINSSSNHFNVSVTSDSSVQSIVLGRQLNFETSQVHNVVLTCFDSEGNSTNATLIVTVQPVNDNQPQFMEREYYFTMSRLLTTGNEIGRVVANDDDIVIGGDLTYTMTENENFQIQGDGSIILSDFVYVVEGQVFTLMVTASDGEFSDSATVIITVNGVLSIPEVILTCMGVLVFLALAVFVIVFCCYCCVCCSRLIPKQRHHPPDVKNENATDGMINVIPVSVPVHMMPGPPGGMYDQGKGQHAYMMGQNPMMMGWGSQSNEEEPSEEEDPDLGSFVTTSSHVYTPTPYLKEMVEMFQEGDEILEGKKKPKKK